jgi:hypothetical protein
VCTGQWRHVILKPGGYRGSDHSGDMHMDVTHSIDALWSKKEGAVGWSTAEK